jgi:hypothetical protein
MQSPYVQLRVIATHEGKGILSMKLAGCPVIEAKVNRLSNK